MRAPDGGFYSSLDADSEGEEGKFYVWTREEARAARDRRGVGGRRAVLRLRPSRRISSATPGTRASPRRSSALPIGSASICSTRIRVWSARAARSSRRARSAFIPARDDKILTSWNALAIAGLARAANALDMPRWTELAFAAADTVKRTAWRDGRLLATRRGERAELNAYLDDHAFMLVALLRAHAAPLSARGLRLGSRDRGRAAGTLRGSRARRLLLHEPRPRSAVPSHEARARQRDAVGQRRGGACACAVRPPRGRHPLHRGGAAHGESLRRGHRAIAGRLLDAARCIRGARHAAGHRDPRRRSRNVRAMAARDREAAIAPTSWWSTCRARATLPSSLVKGERAAARAPSRSCAAARRACPASIPCLRLSRRSRRRNPPRSVRIRPG